MAVWQQPLQRSSRLLEGRPRSRGSITPWEQGKAIHRTRLNKNSMFLCATPDMARQSVMDYTSLNELLSIHQIATNHGLEAGCRLSFQVWSEVNGLFSVLRLIFALACQTFCRQNVLMRGQKQLVVDEALNLRAQSCWPGKENGKFVLPFSNERSSLPSLSSQPFILYL